MRGPFEPTSTSPAVQNVANIIWIRQVNKDCWLRSKSRRQIVIMIYFFIVPNFEIRDIKGRIKGK